jgi:hypothetical protein
MSFNFLRGPTSGHLDIQRMGTGLSVVAGIIYAGAHLYLNHAFSIIEFGTGMGLLLAGGAGGTAMKDTAVSRAVAAAPDARDAV